MGYKKLIAWYFAISFTAWMISLSIPGNDVFGYIALLVGMWLVPLGVGWFMDATSRKK